MALTWSWNAKIGEFKATRRTNEEWKGTLYRGNALLIFLMEDGKQYNLYSFFGDEEHAKNCLGITKGHDNFLEGELEEVTIYSDKTDDKYRKKLIGLLAQGFKNLTIKIKESEEN